jgi:hypothetical protein
LLVDITKSDIEKQLAKSNKENELLNEKMKSMEIQMTKILEVVSKLKEDAMNTENYPRTTSCS